MGFLERLPSYHVNLGNLFASYNLSPLFTRQASNNQCKYDNTAQFENPHTLFLCRCSVGLSFLCLKSDIIADVIPHTDINLTDCLPFHKKYYISGSIPSLMIPINIFLNTNQITKKFLKI